MARIETGWALVVLAALAACGSEPETLRPARPAGPPKEATLTVAGRQVTVELALDDMTRARGLKHRTRLEPDHGMLFIFPDVELRKFWMRDTLISLDIVFLSDDGTVQNIEANAPPAVEHPGFLSRDKARFVLEMAGGWCAEAGLEPGDRIEISPDLVALAK